MSRSMRWTRTCWLDYTGVTKSADYFGYLFYHVRLTFRQSTHTSMIDPHYIHIEPGTLLPPLLSLPLPLRWLAGVAN